MLRKLGVELSGSHVSHHEPTFLRSDPFDFGLGDAAIIDTLRIEWPSGIVQEFRNVAAKQTLTAAEPARLQVQGPGTFRVLCWKGQTFEVQASSDLRQWSAVATLTNLTGTLEFADPAPAGQEARFYRVVSK